MAEDFCSKSLRDDFFITNNSTTECLVTPLENSVDSDGFHADEFFVILDKPCRYCPDIDLDDFVENESLRLLSEFHEKCEKGNYRW